MQKLSLKSLLERAENTFMQAEFETSLRMYGNILQAHPTCDEAKVGVYLSDLGIENEEEAQALFDYYVMIKGEKKNAVDIIDNLIGSLDSSRHHIEDLLNPVEEQVEYSDGIRYSDFLELVKDKGSFKETFEDIMFSTSVVISNKDEFIDFVTKLSNDHFDDMALKYLDASAHLFGNDQEVLALYHVVRENSSEDRL